MHVGDEASGTTLTRSPARERMSTAVDQYDVATFVRTCRDLGAALQREEGLEELNFGRMALHMPGMRDSKAVANFYFRYKLLASTLFPRSDSETNISSAYIDDDYVNNCDGRRAKRRCVRRGEAMLSAMAADCDFTSDSSSNDKVTILVHNITVHHCTYTNENKKRINTITITQW